MGNTLAKKYNLSQAPTASAGHRTLWKIYNGSRKDEAVSVWTFQKEEQIGGLDKSEEEQILRIMRNDVKALRSYESEGLIRAYEVVDESNTIAFVTERVLFSLADLLTKFNDFSSSRFREYLNTEQLTEIEVSRGMLNLIEGLQYLHTVQRKLHLHVAPENIVVTAGSFQWKLCGLGLSLSLQTDETKLASPYFLKESSKSNGIYFEPNLNYCSPEMTAFSSSSPLRYITPAADVFSLGLVLYEIYHFIISSENRSSATITNYCLFKITNNSSSLHRQQCETLKSRMNMHGIPSNVLFLLEGTLQLNPITRFSLTNLMNNPVFNTGQISLLKAIETIQARDVGAQASILSSLHNQLSSFPIRIMEGSILPCLCRLAAANPSMWVYTLPLHVTIAEHISPEAYKLAARETVCASLRIDITSSEVMLCLLKHTPFFVEKLDLAGLHDPIVCLYEHALDKHSGIQSTALQMLIDARVCAAISSPSLNEKILPKVCREACKNPDSEIKTSALAFIGMIVRKLDKEYISKNIIPSLEYILAIDKNVSVTIAVVGVYKFISDTACITVICREILPGLIPLVADKSLGVKQYDLITRFIAYLMNKVIVVRTQQLNTNPIVLSQIVNFEENLLDTFLSNKLDKPTHVSSPSSAFSSSSNASISVMVNPNCSNQVMLEVGKLAASDIWEEETVNSYKSYESNKSNLDSLNSVRDQYSSSVTSSSHFSVGYANIKLESPFYEQNTPQLMSSQSQSTSKNYDPFQQCSRNIDDLFAVAVPNEPADMLPLALTTNSSTEKEDPFSIFK